MTSVKFVPGEKIDELDELVLIQGDHWYEITLEALKPCTIEFDDPTVFNVGKSVTLTAKQTKPLSSNQNSNKTTG